MADRRVLSLFFSTVLFCLVMGVIAPFLPLVAEQKALVEWKTGLIFSAMPMAGLVASPFIGSWMSRLGRRTSLVLSFVLAVSTKQSLSMVIVGCSVWCSSREFFILNLTARAMTGVGSAFLWITGTRYTASTILASDYQDKLFEYIGINESCAGFGVMMGPLLGAGLYAISGYEGVFFGFAFIFALTGACVFCAIGPDRSYTVTSHNQNLLKLLLKPVLVAALFPLVFAVIVGGAAGVFMAPHLEDYGLSTLMIGLLFGLQGGCFLTSSLLVSQLLSGLKKKLANGIGCVLAIIGMSLMGPWPSILPYPFALIIVGFLLAAVALAFLFVEALPSVIEVSTVDLGLLLDDKLLDKFSGLLSMAIFIGEIAGPGIAGGLIPLLGIENTCGTISAFGLVVFLAYILINSWHHRSQQVIAK